MKPSHPSIQAGEFKAKCLQLMDEVNEKHISIVITKHGVPIAMLTPINNTPTELYGCLKDKITIKHDILEPNDDNWEANE